MYKDEEGFTRHDADKCVGCWMCIMVCPFGAISRQESVALKCDLCPDREDSFACVEACPTNALFVGTWDEFKEKLRQEKR
jgi:carbon-monoxide dehydrogenase iron sulfur subunit